jgi:hypothetical protein
LNKSRARLGISKSRKRVPLFKKVATLVKPLEQLI